VTEIAEKLKKMGEKHDALKHLLEKINQTAWLIDEVLAEAASLDVHIEMHGWLDEVIWNAHEAVEQAVEEIERVVE
jgi:hypothetical protein